MNDLEKFVIRLKKIGIEVELIGNYPWIYLHKVNGIRVQGRFNGNHGFTAFFLEPNGTFAITDIGRVFDKIRETITER